MNSLRFAVIGQPIAHSKSPEMHGAAYRALGLPHTYEKVLTTEAELPERVAALREGIYAGINVTVPWKSDILAFVDELDPSARATGATNTLVRTEKGIRAHNTDAPAIASELAALAGDRERFRGRSALVLGSGGAARAAIFALATLRVGHIIVRARRDIETLTKIPREAIATIGGTPARISFERLSSGDVPPESPDLVAIVQATTAGMLGGDAPGAVVADAVAWETVPPDCVVLDVVYTPSGTSLLDRARKEKLANTDGIGMLARQGALALELWLGIPAPYDVMRAALVKSMSQRPPL